ncbi:hypothetical protein ABFS83_10G163000 [Erythranthe nasuta]
MSPPIASPHKPDFPSMQGFNFSAGSTDAAGFNQSKIGPEKSNISSRSRPRLMKIRRKQMAVHQDGKSAKGDLGLNGFSDFSGEIKFDAELRNGSEGNNGNSESNGSVRVGDSNGKIDQHGNGLGFGGNLNDSVFGLGLGSGRSLFGSSINNSTSNLHLNKGEFLFPSSKDSSNVASEKETGSSLFGASRAGSVTNVDLPGGGSVSGPHKSGLPMDTNSERQQFVFDVAGSESGSYSNFRAEESRGDLGQSEVHEFHESDQTEFVFGSHKYDPSSRNLDQQDSKKPDLHFSVGEFGNLDSAKFVFGAATSVSSAFSSNLEKQESGEGMDNGESDKGAQNAEPDMTGKVELDASGDSKKVCNPCSQFSFNWNDSSSENNVKFVFGWNDSDSKLGADLEKKTIPPSMGTSSFTDGTSGDFIFGGPKGKEHCNSDGTIKFFSGMDQLNRGKTEDCNDSRQDNRSTGSNIDSKFQNNNSSGGSVEKGPAFSISEEMKRLNVGESEVDSNNTNFTVNNNNVFVFGNDQKKSGFEKENPPVNMNEAIPDVSHSTRNNSESNRTSSSLFPSVVGIDIQVDGEFCEAPSMNKNEKESISLASKVAESGLSDADCSTPNTKFVLSNFNLFPAINKKLDNTNSKLLGSRRSKKRNGKPKQKPVVHQFFSQDSVSKEGSSQLNHRSPGWGSPMDFSPYQDTSASNTSQAYIDTGTKLEFSLNEKPEPCEKPHDEESGSNLSPSLPAQDGLSAIRRQYKVKKYKLKDRLNHTVQGSNSDKENTEQESVGTATHELCEHWRTRGNQAYHARKLSIAEEFYSMGINSVQHVSILGYSMKPLLLCYSNRAATRMSLGRMREALEDCTKATELDPKFMKVTLRAGNCYLVLGEVEDAIQCYTKCLSADLCLDRKATIEAADGLQKAKRVAEYMDQSAKLLLERTDTAANSALVNIGEALSVSRYSERLLKMKGDALCILRMYDKVIQLCEQTLDIARNNFGADQLMLWRSHLLAKSHYCLGRLELALDLIEKQEKLPVSSGSGDASQESIALAATIQELLGLKKLGNEAFNSRRYTDAIENYNAAISKSFESRPFLAVCFCNRAAAYQSISQIVDAIADCSVAIALDENYEKAISRRATLHEMIRDYKQAVYDLQRLISLLESQSQTKSQQNVTQSKSGGGSVKDLRKARRRLSSLEEKSKKEISLDHYLILGIKASDAESDIKKAYRKAALRHHPDKAGQVFAKSDVGDDGTLWKQFGEKIYKDADRLFKTIGEAYAVLSDPSKRSKYDSEEELRNIYRDSGRPSTSYSSPFERGSGWSGRQAAGFSTSFERNNYSRRNWNESRSHSRWHWEDL